MTNALAESQAPHACVISGMWLLRFMVNPREALKYGLKSLAIEIWKRNRVQNNSERACSFPQTGLTHVVPPGNVYLYWGFLLLFTWSEDSASAENSWGLMMKHSTEGHMVKPDFVTYVLSKKCRSKHVKLCQTIFPEKFQRTLRFIGCASSQPTSVFQFHAKLSFSWGLFKLKNVLPCRDETNFQETSEKYSCICLGIPAEHLNFLQASFRHANLLIVGFVWFEACLHIQISAWPCCADSWRCLKIMSTWIGCKQAGEVVRHCKLSAKQASDFSNAVDAVLQEIQEVLLESLDESVHVQESRVTQVLRRSEEWLSSDSLCKDMTCKVTVTNRHKLGAATSLTSEGTRPLTSESRLKRCS